MLKSEASSVWFLSSLDAARFVAADHCSTRAVVLCREIAAVLFRACCLWQLR